MPHESSDVLLGSFAFHITTRKCHQPLTHALHCEQQEDRGWHWDAAQGRSGCECGCVGVSVETCFMYFISCPRKHGPYRVSSCPVSPDTVGGRFQRQIGAKSALVMQSRWLGYAQCLIKESVRDAAADRPARRRYSRKGEEAPQYSNVACIDKEYRHAFVSGSMERVIIRPLVAVASSGLLRHWTEARRHQLVGSS